MLARFERIEARIADLEAAPQPPPDPQPEPTPGFEPAPAPSPAPTPPVSKPVIELYGKVPTEAQARAISPIVGAYLDRFGPAADKLWSTDGPKWEGDYYDRGDVYYLASRLFNNPTYLDRGHQQVITYRRDYLEANTYGASAHWMQTPGLAAHFELTGDEASRYALGYMATAMGRHWWYVGAGDSALDKPGTDGRQQARYLEVQALSAAINAPSPKTAWDAGGQDHRVQAKVGLDMILRSQGADGAWRHTAWENKVSPYMTGMLLEALAQYQLLVEPDARISDAIKRAADYLWANCWDQKSRSFFYIEGNGEPAPDLNGLIVYAFAWLYANGFGAEYRDRALAMFDGSNRGAWIVGSKQFNQTYRGLRALALLI
jgi:hypothetical protein